MKILNNRLYLRMRKDLASFVLVFFLIKAQAQENTIAFTNYTTANGLADNAVYSLIQDSRGFMWIGTREGLSRFDGTNFKNFFTQKNNNNALPGNTISSLHEYIPGHLLLATNGGIICFNTITQQFYQPNKLKVTEVFSITRLKKDLFSFNKKDTVFLVNEHLAITDTLVPPIKNKNNFVNSFPLDEKTLLVGSLRSYFLFDIPSGKYTSFLDGNALSYRDKTFTFQYYDTKNKWLYFSNYFGGLYRYSYEGVMLFNWKKGNGVSELIDANISFIKSKNDSTLWIGGYEGGGLTVLNSNNNKLNYAVGNAINSSLVFKSMTFSYTDREKNEWLGTNNGISMLHNTTSGIKSWKEAFTEISNSNTLLNITKAADQQVYVSVYGTNISYKINKPDGGVSLLNPGRIPFTWCMNNFGSELIFTGNGSSITKYNPVTNQYQQSDFLKNYFPASDIVILAFKHSNGDEWYSGNNGGGFVRVSAVDGSIHTYKKDGPRGQFTVSYYANYAEDKNGDLWFGVNKSGLLLHWNKEKDFFTEINFETVKDISGEIRSGITDIALDKDNNIWLALDGSGIIKYDPRRHAGFQYSIEDGLPTNYSYGLKFDNKNRLWIGTLKGLSCLLVNEKRFINFTKETGLPADYFDERCMYYDSSTNQLWAGSKNILMQFDPDVLLNSTQRELPVYIDEIIVNGKKYTGDDSNHLQFSPTQNNLQFHFIGLDINNGKNIEYSYLLSGADKDWNFAGSNLTASYANLKPGNYRFRIQVKYKGDKLWKEMKEPLQFTIATPWQKTWWFKLIAFAAIALLVGYLITSYYSRKLEKQKAELEKQKAVEQERTRISTDMHDDFGASLSRIKFLSEKLQLHSPGHLSEKNDLEKISLYSDEMAEKMNEIVWALNQRYDSYGDLVSFCRSYASEYLQDKNIKLHFSSGELSEKKIQGEVRRNIFLVIKEALHNIVKHARATEVSISFTHTKDLTVTIHDNGKGIDMANLRPFANGLENMKKRMADVQGSFYIENKAGTQISINAPV